MEKKKRDTMLPKRFNADDIKNWQNEANKTTGVILPCGWKTL